MKSILFLINFLLAIQAIFTIHQTQNAFLKDSIHCYSIQPLPLSYGDTSTYKIGIRYQNYSRSMETFINLVEKIEQTFEERNRRISAEALAKNLLKSYHIYGLYGEKFTTFDVKRYNLLYDELTDILLDNGGSLRVDPMIKEVLTVEEQCILHYILSRFEWPLNEVQTIFDLDGTRQRKSNGMEDAWNQVKRRMNSKNMQFRNEPASNGQSNVKYDYYEQGIVRFRNSETDAIETSRVLIGMLAGLVQNTPRLNNHEIYEKLQQMENFKTEYIGNATSIRNEKRLDVLIGLTLADLWAQNSKQMPSQSSNRKSSQASGGQWNSDICPVYYQMQPSNSNQQNNGMFVVPEFNGLSLAQLRGGLDGLSIGYTLKNLKLSKNQFRLSTILKMYYSVRGLSVESSVCRRQETFEIFLNQLKAPALQYFQLIHLYLGKGNIKDEFTLLPYINENEMDFQSKLSDAAAISDANRQFCQEKPMLRANAIKTNGNAYNGVSDSLNDNSIQAYNRRKSKFSILNGEDSAQPSKYSETPSDLLFLVDLSNSLNQQLTIINKIVSQHTMYSRETVSILLNRPGKNEFEDGLEPIAWRSEIKDRPVCELKNLIAAAEKTTYTISRASELIDRIEHMILKFKNEQNSTTMIAGKVFILFNYGSIKYDRSQEFLQAKRNLYIKHRDVSVAIIGQGDRNDLKNLINFKDTDDNVFEVNTDLDLLSLNVQKLINDNSAIVIYERSSQGSSRFHETVQQNYVTPNAVQFFTITPNYFFATEYLELKFELRNNRDIKVCYSRSDPKPSSESLKTNDLECKSTREDQNPLIFHSSNPCSGYSKEDCPPIYLGIYGLKDDQAIADCFELQCTNIDQIQYEFSHQGMYYGAGFSFKLSLSVLFTASLAIIFQFCQHRF